MNVFFNQEALEVFMRGFGFWGPAVFFLLQVIQVIIAPLPGNLLTMVGGILFGLWPGFLLAYTANIIGSLIGFTLARKAGRAVAIKLIGAARFDKWMRIIGTESANSRTKILLILVVLFPFLPSDLMCLVVGMTPISYRAFTIIVITCRPWGQFAAALLGVGSFHMSPGVFFPLLAVLIIICVAAVIYAPKLEHFSIQWAHKLTDRFSGKSN